MKILGPEIFELKRDLSSLGWNSIEEWSKKFGYKSNTVNKVIKRHWCKDTKPYGKTTKDILSDLRKTLKDEIRRDCK